MHGRCQFGKTRPFVIFLDIIDSWKLVGWGKMGFKAQTCWTDLLAFWGVWNWSRILNFGPDRLFFRFSRALLNTENPLLQYWELPFRYTLYKMKNLLNAEFSINTENFHPCGKHKNTQITVLYFRGIDIDILSGGAIVSNCFFFLSEKGSILKWASLWEQILSF